MADLVGVVERGADELGHGPVDDHKVLVPVALRAQHSAHEGPRVAHQGPPGLNDELQPALLHNLPHLERKNIRNPAGDSVKTCK